MSREGERRAQDRRAGLDRRTLSRMRETCANCSATFYGSRCYLCGEPTPAYASMVAQDKKEAGNE